MTKPWQLVPLLAAAALAASAWWWQTEKDAWRAPPARNPELPTLADISAPPVFRARNAVARPVLWTSRRPAGTDEQKGGLAQELMQSRLTAVIASGKEQIAILQRKDGSPLRLSGETKPWRIESFDGRKAIFVSADQQRVERLLEQLPAAAPRPGLPQGLPPKLPAAQ